MLRWIVCLLLVGVPVAAQESAALVAFRDHVLNQQLVLTDYSADAERKYEFRAEALSSTQPHVREFAFFIPASVTVKNKTIMLVGDRQFVVQDSVTHQLSATNIKAPMKVSVTFPDGTVDELLPTASKLLFWPTVGDAYLAIPDYVAKLVPANYDSKVGASVPCNPCSSGKAYPSSADLVVMGSGSKVTPPKLLHIVDPSWPPGYKVQGRTTVTASMTVGLDGKVSDIWIVEPSYDGFVQECSKALQEYRFKPGELDGHPVAVRLNTVMSFETRH